jgi:hypothetical protein
LEAASEIGPEAAAVALLSADDELSDDFEHPARSEPARAAATSTALKRFT